MTYQKHCPGCYAEKGGAAVCPACGYDESAPRSPLFLPHGIVIGGQFRVGRVLGKPGGFGITYIGWDIHLQQRVAIKEYLPRDLATRTAESLDVHVHTDADQANFAFGREQFLREARIVARFSHPNIVRVRSFFNANGTAYLVMDYYEGVSLGEYLSTVRNSLMPGVALRLMRPILQGLQYVHERNVIHRDVKPHNIYLAADGRPILLDFGAAMPSAGERPHSLVVVVTEGYAPLEQYQRRSPQGPYTDVYGVAATLYRMIAGELPPMALDRLGHDPLQQSGYSALPPAMREGMARALAVRPQDRYASAEEFLAFLDGLDEEEIDTGDRAAAVFVRPDHRPRENVTTEVSVSLTGEKRAVSALLPEPPTRPVGEGLAVVPAVAPVPAAAAPAAVVAPPSSDALPARWRWIVALLAAISVVEFVLLVAR
ncbi:serine/threonine-protein kinase [Solimonas sp. K1W22B-7]|uniref:serine/threonine-protein kinase n=1 Tax=Solimonas sp. K1W22B-7 TaxID=2303331 RepID=UPI0013C492E3|nr:serine/threonine-protein kinase [Solimonas sp. K1W22B-7]